MADKVIISKSIITDICDAVREKTNSEGLISTADIGAKIREIKGGSGVTVPNVTNVSLGSDGTLSWTKPVTTGIFDDYDSVTLSYVIYVNETRLTTSNTYYSIGGYLSTEETNEVKIITMAKLTKNSASNGVIENFEYSLPETYVIILEGAKLEATTSNVSAITCGTDIYVFGGIYKSYSSDDVIDDNIYKFDTLTEEISILDVKQPITADSYVLGVKDNIIYILGGYKILYPEIYYKDIYKLDITSQTLEKLDVTLSQTCYGSAWCQLGNKIYMFGGLVETSSQNIPGDSIVIFDMDTETVETLSVKTPYTIYSGSAVAIGTDIYLQWGNSGDFITYRTYFRKFDTLTQTFTTLRDSNSKRDHGLVEHSERGEIISFGGYSGSNYLNSISIYNINTNSWSSSSLVLPYKMSNFGYSKVGNNIYIFGGYSTGGTPLDTIIKYKTY